MCYLWLQIPYNLNDVRLTLTVASGSFLLPESQVAAASPGVPGFAWIPSPGA